MSSPGTQAALGGDRFEQRTDSRQDQAPAGFQGGRGLLVDDLPEARLLDVRHGRLEAREDVIEDARVEAAGEGQILERVLDAEHRADRRGERLAGGAVGADQRAVDIEEPGQPHRPDLSNSGLPRPRGRT